MALKVKFGMGGHKLYATEQTATGIPARVQGVACVGTYGKHILFAPLQLAGNINLKTHIAIVGSSHSLTIQINIAYIHDAGEINQYAPSTKRVGGGEMKPIPTLAHLFETTARQTTLDVGGNIGVVGLFIGCGCHPRLFYLKVVGQIHGAPGGIVNRRIGSLRHISSLKLPTEVEAHNKTALGRNLHGQPKAYQYNRSKMPEHLHRVGF